MSQIVSITVTNRGNNLDPLKGGPVAYGFDIEDIVSPIRYNSNISRSYFTARTNKGGANNNLNGSKIDYRSSDLLSAIVAQSENLLLLNVVSRRGVDMSGEAMIFVAKKVSESFYPVTTGTVFFYIEDGDPLPVEYIVSQTVSQIVSQATPPLPTMSVQDNANPMLPEPNLNFVGFTLEDNPANFSTDIINLKEIDYASLAFLKANLLLPPGAYYKITDRGDQGIIVQALKNDEISQRAIRLMNVPISYTGVIGSFSIKGVYDPNGTYASGDIVIWGGQTWQNFNFGATGSIIDELTLSADWGLFAKPGYGTTSPNYAVKQFAVIYEFDKDWIAEQSDEYGNVFGLSFDTNQNSYGYAFNPVDISDWNLNTLNFNFHHNRCIGIYNNVCQNINYNTIPGIISRNTSSTINNNTNNGDITLNAIDSILNNSNNGFISGNSCSIGTGFGSSIDYNVNNGLIQNNVFQNKISANVYNGNIAGLTSAISTMFVDHVTNGLSDNYEIDITGLTSIDMDTDCPGIYKGKVLLKSSNPIESIVTILNFPLNKDVIFTAENGLIVTFVHAAGADTPRCKGGMNAIINGTNLDWIEFSGRDISVITQKNIGTY